MSDQQMAAAIRARLESLAPERYKIERETIGTQAHVAKLLGVSRETIARRETGGFQITSEAWLALRAVAKQTRKRAQRFEKPQ